MEDDNWQEFFVYTHKRSNHKLVSLLLSVPFLLEPPICIAKVAVDSTSFPWALSTHKELLRSRKSWQAEVTGLKAVITEPQAPRAQAMQVSHRKKNGNSSVL